uniref:Regulatory factor X, 5 n=1 Tax=Nothobranchius furzeri TaxID=105023 RepID=A0A1A8U590_NOTFU
MAGGFRREQFLFKLPSPVNWEFCRVMDGLSDLDWTRFASEVLKDQTAVRLAERQAQRTDWVMNQWGCRNGRVGELIDLLESLQLFRPRDVILTWTQAMNPSSFAPPPLPPQQQQQHPLAASTSVVQKARVTSTKRPLGGEVLGGTAAGDSAVSPSPVKRKRGRPRKPRPEDSFPSALPPSPSLPLSQPPVITSLTGGVIQKASSSSSSSQPLVELVIQDPPGLVLSQLPAASDPTHRLMEHRGVVVQCQASRAAEPDHHSRSLLVFQSPGNPSWELATSGRTPMVEVIQKAPSNNNSSSAPPHLPQNTLPLPMPLEGKGEVEITLVPVEPNVSLPPPSSPSFTVKVEEEVEEGERGTS